MKVLYNAVLPKAFSASGLHCGIKKSSAKDLGVAYSSLPCDCAGVFTANKVKAASLRVCMHQLKKTSTGRAVIVNSGNANCFVGDRGVRDSLEMIRVTAQGLDVSKKSVFIASTGIIGKPLPISRIKKALPKLCTNAKMKQSSLKNFAESILTTDASKKIISVRVRIKNKTVLITGIAKGAGMIYPRLKKNASHATMLAFILTDANIKRPLLSSVLEQATENSFNRISVDGCMSTNDTVLILANGAAAHKPILRKDKDYQVFSHGLHHVCEVLAKKIIEDAEGGTKLIKINICDAKSMREAMNASHSVMNSNLFKTAMYGNSPNWGRIVSAIGAAGITLDPKKIKMAFNDHVIFRRGKLLTFQTKKILKGTKVIRVDIYLGRGRFGHSVYTSDLTPKYIKINAAYN